MIIEVIRQTWNGRRVFRVRSDVSSDVLLVPFGDVQPYLRRHLESAVMYMQAGWPGHVITGAVETKDGAMRFTCEAGLQP